MSKSTPEATPEIVISHGDEVLFRLRDGARPLEAQTTVRVSYELGVNVIHMGTVEGIGYYDGPDGTPAFALDDGTVIAVEDVDWESMHVNPTAGLMT
ncbi:hypothetical protein [Microbacterium sp.]|uniref:hypothetical protein n=1 Tax=Microbacterium sp. TaxID=51671 RepID=UPI0039E5722E